MRTRRTEPSRSRCSVARSRSHRYHDADGALSPSPAKCQARTSARTAAAVLAGALLPPLLTGWILWIAPLDGLTADRAALAARDFSDLWAAGHLAAMHAFDVLYHPTSLTAFLRASFGPGMPEQIWPYPPPTLLLAALSAILPLLPSFAAYLHRHRAGHARLARSGAAFGHPLAWAAILLSPAVADNALGRTKRRAHRRCHVRRAALHPDPATPRRIAARPPHPQTATRPHRPDLPVAGRHWRILLTAASRPRDRHRLGPCFGIDAWTGFFLTARPEIAAYFQAPWTGSGSQRMFASVFMAARDSAPMSRAPTPRKRLPRSSPPRWSGPPGAVRSMHGRWRWP